MARPPSAESLLRNFKKQSNKSRSLISNEMIIPNHSGDHSAGSTGTPNNEEDLANKKYVDDNAGLWEIDGAEAQLKATRSIDMQTRQIINLNTPTSDTDASNKLYVDDNIVTSADIDHNQTINTHNLTTDIDHTTISNIGTNSHAQIDTHIADSTDPHGSSLTQTDLDVTGESKGSRVLITAGSSVNYTGLEKNMNVGSCSLQGDKGIPMPRAGSIVGMSVMADCSAFTSSGTFTYRCYKNGSVVFSGSYTISSTGVTTHEVTQARGTDRFVAGDIIKLSGQGNVGYTINNTLMTLELQFDT